MSFLPVTLETISSIHGGKRIPKGDELSPVLTEHLYIRARDIREGKISIENPVYIDARTASKIKQYTVDTNDIVITIVGVNIGDIGFISEQFSGSNLTENAARIRVDTTKCNPRFLALNLSMNKTKERFNSIASGSAQGKLGLYKIKNFQISLPPLLTQNRIADIISVYDDLIENNRRRIQLLERSLHLLYKEWFVHLRFPSHEHSKIVDGIPEGWSKIPLGEALTLQRGFDLPTAERKNGKYPVFASTGINGYHDQYKVKAPCVVTGRSGSLGTVLYVAEDFWPLNTTLWGKEFKLVEPLIALYLLRSLKLEQYNGGAAVPTLNRNDVHRIEFSCPPKKLQEFFLDVANPIYSQMRVLEQQNVQLKQARDLLLPKLMSGAIGV